MRNVRPSAAGVMPARARQLSAGRKLLFTSVCVLVVLITCEAAVRVRARLRYGTAAASAPDSLLVYNEQLGIHVPRPGYTVEANKISLRINSLGFRGEEIARTKPPNTLRIACLGASTTFSAEVADQATWPHKLQQALQARLPNVTVQVINAGIPGAIASHSLKNLQHRVLPLQPDLVIYYEAHNEVHHDTRELARGRGLLKPTEEHRSALARRLAEYSLLFDLVEKNAKILLASRDRGIDKLNGIPRDLPDRFLGELGKIHQELSRRNITLVLSTFLVKYRRDQPRPVQIANADISFFYMPWMTIDDLMESMDVYNDAIVEYAHARGVPVAEDRTSIPGDSHHFADAVHLADAGSALMAERFRRFLYERKILDELVKKMGKASPEVRPAAGGS